MSAADRSERELTLVMLENRVSDRRETLYEIQDEGLVENLATVRAVLGAGVDSINAAAQRRTQSAARVRGARGREETIVVETAISAAASTDTTAYYCQMQGRRES